MHTHLRPVGNTLIRGQLQPRPQYQLQGYMPNGTSGPVPGAQPLQPNNGRIIQNGPVRILCVADVRGRRGLSGGVQHLLTLCQVIYDH